MADTDKGQILLADDEETFLESAAELLREEGYKCDCTGDAHGARKLLDSGDYDVVIADIKMPGNPDLEFVRDLPSIAPGVPVILVTGYPSLDTAIGCLDLPVAAYLVKPVDLKELLEQVESAMASRQAVRVMQQAQERLEQMPREVRTLEELSRSGPRDGSPLAIKAFLTLSIRNVMSALSDIEHLAQALAASTQDEATCRLLKCPRLTAMLAVLKETIDALRASRNAFKSREIADLRTKLERFYEQATRRNA